MRLNILPITRTLCFCYHHPVSIKTWPVTSCLKRRGALQDSLSLLLRFSIFPWKATFRPNCWLDGLRKILANAAKSMHFVYCCRPQNVQSYVQWRQSWSLRKMGNHQMLFYIMTTIQENIYVRCNHHWKLYLPPKRQEPLTPHLRRSTFSLRCSSGGIQNAIHHQRKAGPADYWGGWSGLRWVFFWFLSWLQVGRESPVLLDGNSMQKSRRAPSFRLHLYRRATWGIGIYFNTQGRLLSVWLFYALWAGHS